MKTITDEEIRAEAERLFSVPYPSGYSIATGYFEKGAKWYREQMGEQGWIELIKAMNDYITVLGKELDDCAVMLSVHGWQSKRVQEGIDARNKILEIKARMSLPTAPKPKEE